MSTNYTPIDLNNIKTYSITERKRLVKKENFAKVLPSNPNFNQFLDGLPKILAGANLKALVKDIALAYKNEKMVIFGMGGHVIKCGLSPIIINLMKEGVIRAVALNGAGIIHDFEIAFTGETSEDVAENIVDGSFGMAKETSAMINEAIIIGAKQDQGIGQSVGKMIWENRLQYHELSILGQGFNLGIPVTVHVAIGTDIIHQHPCASGEAIGKGSMLDFRIFASNTADLEGGVFLNAGCAVIIPEVFLKALTVVRNLGYKITNFTTANFDMIAQYRPLTNVVKRPVLEGGKGYSFIGHHELMIPLLSAAILEEINSGG